MDVDAAARFGAMKGSKGPPGVVWEGKRLTASWAGYVLRVGTYESLNVPLKPKIDK